MPNAPSFSHHKHRGSALLLLLIIVVVGAAFLLNALTSNPHIERDKVTADALAKAKEALIGYAATYRDTHPGQVFGYLPCPDTDNDGVAENSCGSFAGTSVIGRLPWRTLGLPPLRDSSGECLWYAVSGSYKNAPTSAAYPMNWDAYGQFAIQDADGAVLAGATAESHAAAVIFSPRSIIGSQNRTPVGTTECGGNTTISAYLDVTAPFYAGTEPAAGAATTLTIASAASIAGGSNNDQALWITPGDVFNRVKQRNDFTDDVNALITDLATCLNAMPAASLPSAAGSKGIDGPLNDAAIITCLGTDPLKTLVRTNWKENLLYAKPGGTITVNGAPCNAVLIFGGERTTGQTRATAADKNNAAMYLEGANATAFPGGTVYSGAGAYAAPTPTADVTICITGGGGGGTQVTFSNPTDFDSFIAAGRGVTMNSTSQTASITVATGSNGGCFWFPTPFPLNGKTLRAYYQFQFANPDPIGGVDLGYGFSLSFLEGDLGMPTTCGTQSRMGVVPASDRPFSLFVETDIRQDSGNGEPNGTPNHTAIMLNGNIDHSLTGGSLTSACDGTSYGCLHSPANKFEESPAPTAHSQRVEIHTGYDSNCTASGGAYALAKVWVDCAACSDTAVDFTATPTASRCFELVPQMNTIYFGFTGGFSSAGGGQGVVIWNLDMRTK